MEEKEEYRKKIIEMVKNVNRKDILIYIFKIVEDIIKNMNAIIEKREGKYDYEVADVYESSVTSHLQKDGVHPDSQGQQIIADLVCKEYEK